MNFFTKKIFKYKKIIAALAAAAVFTLLLFAACLSKRALEDAPIITSATNQHTLYNGRGQPIEANSKKVEIIIK
jgi:hypothetical protein